MARKGRKFELSYEWLYKIDKEKYAVKSPAFILNKTTNRKREIDVLVEFYDEDKNLRRLSIECRDRSQVQDATWIEQLKTKKEDLELDYIIATTTKNFTKGAIKKAKHHGVIIEKAEMFNRQVLEEATQEFFIDLFFLKFEFLSINFLTKSGEILSFKDLYGKIPIHLQYQLIRELNTGLYFSIEPHQYMDDKNFDKKTFFEKSDNSFITLNSHAVFDKEIPKIIQELEIMQMFSEIKLIPFRLSIPLNKSMSVFEIEKKKNKKYFAFFGSDEEYVEYGYLDDKKIYSKMQLKERPHFRLISMDMKINTIFPNIEENMTFDMDELFKNGIGSFDFSKVI